MKNQLTDTVMMVRPIAFHRNEQTAVNNLFQPREQVMDEETSQQKAVREFDKAVELLRKEGIEVLVFEDNDDFETPDSIFPNNWNSFHEGGMVYLYPMFAENRREERREDILKALAKRAGIMLRIKSFEHFEKEDKFLEGTGSLILDRQNQLAYAALSERTHPDVIKAFADETGFSVVVFTAFQTFKAERRPVYHTNVMMCLGEKFALICADCIDDPEERANVLNNLNATGKEIVFITEEQRDEFAGNMLQLKNKEGARFIVMSEAAFQSLRQDQVAQLEKHGKLIAVPIPTIEKLGGGSIRCMICEIFH